MRFHDYESELLNQIADLSGCKKAWKAKKMGVHFNKMKEEVDLYRFGEDEIIRICPEPLQFIKQFRDISNNQEATKKRFLEMSVQFPIVSLKEVPKLMDAPMWLNKTTKGINLRPGIFLNDDRERFRGVVMGDECVHGLIAGRTGSGKSVFLNTLILGLLSEYAPWELDLYLADFKKVELSRYMNDFDAANNYTAFTPHVKACAATEEVTYVLSLLRYLADCMNARNQFFMQLGITKLEDFRDEYNMVLPRVLLIVDEFQQMFKESISFRKEEEIKYLIRSIAKLGRATGYHLLFASQDLSGTRLGDIMPNFKMRMALSCDGEVSNSILGYSDAKNLDIGEVLINADKHRLKYHVPMISVKNSEIIDEEEEVKKAPFYQLLDEIKNNAQNYKNGLEYKILSQKFYREELQEKEKDYLRDLELICAKKNAFIEKNNEKYFDAIILGKITEYTDSYNEKTVLYIERERNKAIILGASQSEHVARMRKLLTENLIRSSIPTQHVSLELNNLVEGYFNIEEHVEKKGIHSCYKLYNAENAEKYFKYIYEMRRASMGYLHSETNQAAIERFVEIYRKLSSEMKKTEKKQRYLEYHRKYKELSILHKERKAQIEQIESEISIEMILLEYLGAIDKTLIDIGNGNMTCMEYSLLPVYGQLRNILQAEHDFEAALIEVENLVKNELEDTPETVFTSAQLWMLGEAISYFKACCNGMEPNNTRFKELFEEIFHVCQGLDDYANAYKEYKRAERELMKLEHPYRAWIDELQRGAQDYIHACFYSVLTRGYNKQEYCIPEVFIVENENGDILFKINPKKKILSVSQGMDMEALYQKEADMQLEILNKRIQNQQITVKDYSPMVFWINGLDQVERINESYKDMMRNSSLYNILVIASVTTENLNVERQIFNYILLMGNAVRIYEKYETPYQGQEADSFVVTSYIRNQELTTTFKMYASELNKMEQTHYIEDLLNDIYKAGGIKNEMLEL